MAHTISHATPMNVDYEQIVAWLEKPGSYPEPTRHVERIETHISQVFVTDRFVYKLKKPVQYSFIDFSSAELRERACRAELQLNRRLAPQTYLSVLPIVARDDGSLHFSGKGRVVDWLVQMRRLPAERMLDRAIESGHVNEVDLHRLAECLTRFYLQAPPVIIRPEVYLARLIENVRANFDALQRANPELQSALVAPVHTAQLRLLKSMPEMFAARALDGRIVDGHGDLRPEHICLLDPPAIFDCIEFSAELRQVDVADELSFLSMECDHLGSGQIGQMLLNDYLHASGDRPSAVLLAFYKSYRACVRAKVAALRARQLPVEQRPVYWVACRRYLELANHYLHSVGVRPMVVLVMGLMGSGKSTLARALADELGLAIIRTDDVRDQLSPPSALPAAYGQGRYRQEQRDQVYAEQLRQAGERLERGESVVLDGTFAGARPREAALTFARHQGADTLLVECTCPREVAIDRIRSRQLQRSDASEARPDLFDLQVAEYERSPSLDVACRVDTTEAVAAQLEQVYRALPNAGS